MARYISLIRFTDEGVAGLQKTTARAADFCKVAEKLGVTIESQLWTTGSFDGLLILRGDEMKILACLAKLVAQGKVRTETLRAFDAREIKDIIG
jgi:uncharacterized protein with GYD domain